MISARCAAWQAVSIYGGSGEALVAVAGQGGDQAVEFQRQQFAEQPVGAQSAALDQIVQGAGVVAERLEYVIFAGCRSRRGDGAGFGITAKFFQNVLCRFDQFGSLLDQLVATAGNRGMNRPGNGKDLATLFRRKAGGDQRTAFGRAP